MIANKVKDPVDKDIDDIDLMLEAFQDVEGVELNRVTNQEAFLPSIPSSPPNICPVVFDISMPDHSGLELDEILSKLPRSKDFAITLFSTFPNSLPKAKSIWPHIPKPAKLAQL